MAEPEPKRPHRDADRWVFNVLAWKTCEEMALQLQARDPTRFLYQATRWGKFADSGMDNIQVGGFHPVNVIGKSHILFLASFDNNDAILSQFHVLTMLCESFIKTLTVVIPYFPMGTMEIVSQEGQVATANTVSRMLSSLPSIGCPIRVMIYDLHTLQNRFYFHSSACASLCTTIPVLQRAILSNPEYAFDVIAFPDEGACKRFGRLFSGYPLVVCGKKRIGDERHIVIQDGDPGGRKVLIVDDVVKSGGTMAECAATLLRSGATSVSAFCAHCGLPRDAVRRFSRGGDRSHFEYFFVTNSNRLVTNALPQDDCFVVLDLLPQIAEDLDK
eukprot:GGOE01049407.1.p1 GENE.GGOE01049407.1~~GGOE01049407.1.p1  ORF type:complete len:351 (-),score=121.84 GGOE01049407.1:432-1421(-)